MKLWEPFDQSANPWFRVHRKRMEKSLTFCEKKDQRCFFFTLAANWFRTKTTSDMYKVNINLLDTKPSVKKSPTSVGIGYFVSKNHF